MLGGLGLETISGFRISASGESFFELLRKLVSPKPEAPNP